jgi:3-oxoacyl-[acyl-carrier protein] reductase
VDLELRGKNAVVTGGTRGIGWAIARRLASEGCGVGICGRTPGDLASAGRLLEQAGTPAFTRVADVTAPGSVESFIDDAAAALGGLDLLVANVGATVGGGLMESTSQDWTQTLDLNVGHAVRSIRASVPHLRRRSGGAIIIIASISGWKPSPRAQYGAAKAAEIYLASAFANELAADNIRVNTVSPGSVLVPGGAWAMYRDHAPDAFAEFEQRAFPAGRLGTADEIADVVTFLLSDRARWINGAHIPVDGAQGRPSARGY